MNDSLPDAASSPPDRDQPDAQNAGAPSSKPDRGSIASIVHGSLALGAGWCWIHLVVGAILQLTVRDRIPYLAAVDYASPQIVLALLALLLSVRQWTLHRKRLAAALLAAVPVLAVWWHLSVHVDHPHAKPDPGDVRVLFWNTRYIHAGWPTVIAELQKHDADVIGLVEVDGVYPEDLSRLRKAFPAYQIEFVYHGLMFIRGKWTQVERNHLGHRSDHARAIGTLADGRPIELHLVDIYALPFSPRGPAFHDLDKLLADENVPDRKNAIVMGDFNTPPDSVHYAWLRQHFENTFEAAGSGHYVTWPVGAPVLALDQIWVPKGRTTSCRLDGTPYSDHRLVTATLRR